MSVSYISAGELASKLQSNDDSVVVIDVRSAEEFQHAGHITSAVHISSDRWESPEVVDEILGKYSGKSTIVVHCLMSQVRGPTCARILHSKLQSSEIPVESRPEVYVTIYIY